jgi:hypothetical protein
MILKGVFGPKRDEMRRIWRKLRNEGLYNLYTSPSIITMMKSTKMRCTRHVAHIGAKRYPEGKRPLGRPRRRWVNNIKINLRELGWDGMDGIDLRIGTSGRLL